MDLILDELNSFKAELVELDIYGHAKEFIYNRPGKKHGVFSSLAVFIKDYFTWLRKRLYSSSLIFSNLIKVTKILMKNVQHSCLCFISLRAWGVLRFIVSIKNIELYKILPWDKFFTKKKKEFQNTFSSYRIFLELQCLVGDSVDVLELPMFINIYMQFIFKKKNSHKWLKLMTCSYIFRK